MMAWVINLLRRKPKFKYISPMYKGPDLYNGCLMPEKSLQAFEAWLVSEYGPEILQNRTLGKTLICSPGPLMVPREETMFLFLYFRWIGLN